jgi:Isochorismatase family
MADTFTIDPAHTAVLSMDCQAGIVSIYTREAKDAFLARVASVLKHARATGMTIIHIQVGFRPGFPEISSRNALFNAIKSSEQHQQLFREPHGGIPDTIAPQDNEIVITKHRISAFTGTDLAMILRAMSSIHWFFTALRPVVSSYPLLSTLLTPITALRSSAIVALTWTQRFTIASSSDSSLHAGRSSPLRVLSPPRRGRINNRERFLLDSLLNRCRACAAFVRARCRWSPGNRRGRGRNL